MQLQEILELIVEHFVAKIMFIFLLHLNIAKQRVPKFVYLTAFLRYTEHLL